MLFEYFLANSISLPKIFPTPLAIDDEKADDAAAGFCCCTS